MGSPADLGADLLGSSVTPIGDTTQIVIPAGTSGELELAVNDYSIFLDDNNGAYTVIFR